MRTALLLACALVVLVASRSRAVSIGATTSPAVMSATWKVRDATTAAADWSGGDEAAAKLKLRLDSAADGDLARCTVTDTSGADRAVTLAYCVPLAAVGGTWCDDPQRSRVIEATKTYSNVADGAGGIDDRASLYPVAVVAHGALATCLAAPPDEPRMVRFVYDAPRKELRAEFDFGLSKDVEKFPSRADAAVVRFDVPVKWAFRRAIQRYHERYPDVFKRRATTGGTWLPFSESGPIENAGDFGFAFHEIADHQVEPRVLADDARIGCGSYVYVEPQSHWQHYAGKGPGTYEQRLVQLESEAAAGSPAARATLVSGALRATGRRDIYLETVAYTPMRPWGCDANPLIPGGKGAYEFDRMLKLLDLPGVDGVYVDSSEGWGEVLNFNRDHWRVAQHPLTFDPSTKRPALLNFWGTVSWVKRMSGESRRRGQPLFANDVFFRRWQLAAYVDVPGREYTWTDSAGALAPPADERYLFLRAMSGKRPYLMLMNNRYDDGSLIEPYFQRSLFYAVFPSFFLAHQSTGETAYFSNPAWYNRDRALFRKYLPLIRQLDEAGWEPVPHADVSPPQVRIERYGSFARGTLAYTVHNPAAEEHRVTITLDPEEARAANAEELMAGRATEMTRGSDGSAQLRLTLPGGAFAMLRVR